MGAEGAHQEDNAMKCTDLFPIISVTGNGRNPHGAEYFVLGKR